MTTSSVLEAHPTQQSTGDDSHDSAQITWHCPSYPERYVVQRHQHQRAQLLYAVRGTPQLERLMGVLLDEIQQLKSPPLYLPAPLDNRLRSITETLMADPENDIELQQWTQTVDASSRTLARLFERETGMTFSAWRQQLRLLSAIERPTAGQSVTTVALDLGYQSPSAFIAMFRRALGSSPGKYMSSNYKQEKL